MPDAADRPYIPQRHVHLDFHTGPAVPDVGADFDPDTFAEPFVQAGVDSVTVFGKCHHGHLYWDTEHGARHPSLPAGLIWSARRSRRCIAPASRHRST